MLDINWWRIPDNKGKSRSTSTEADYFVSRTWRAAISPGEWRPHTEVQRTWSFECQEREYQGQQIFLPYVDHFFRCLPVSVSRCSYCTGFYVGQVFFMVYWVRCLSDPLRTFALGHYLFITDPESIKEKRGIILIWLFPVEWMCSWAFSVCLQDLRRHSRVDLLQQEKSFDLILWVALC